MVTRRKDGRTEGIVVGEIKGRGILFLLLIGVWLLLTYPFSAQEGVAGVAVALVVVLLPTGSGPILSDLRLTPKAMGYLIFYLFVFLGELIKANFDVAFRVLQPRLPIKPGIVAARTSLTSPIARTILANSITLTPGTITVDMQGEYLYVHWITVRSEDPEAATREIVAKFEGYLEVIFG